MQNINKIDPKRAAQPNSPIFNKLGIGIALFLTALDFITIRLSINATANMQHALICLVALLIAFSGNMMQNIQPNYFAGIKLPWTLSSNYNWRKTHQLAGKLWMIYGLLAAVLSLVLPLHTHHIIIISSLLVLIVIPVTYSFILFRKEQANPEIANEDNL